jgi:hypothetical protein
MASMDRKSNLRRDDACLPMFVGINAMVDLRCTTPKPLVSPWGQKRPSGHVGSNVRFARRRTWLKGAHHLVLCGSLTLVRAKRTSISVVNL